MGSCTDACRQICVNTPCTATPSTSEAHVGSGAVLAGLEPDHAPGEGPAVHAHPPWLDARRRLVRQPRGSDGDEDTSGPRLGDPQALRLRRSVRPWFPTPVRIRSRGRQACFGRTLDKHTCMYTSSLLVCPPPTPLSSLCQCVRVGENWTSSAMRTAGSSRTSGACMCKSCSHSAKRRILCVRESEYACECVRACACGFKDNQEPVHE